jgi:uncharacterized protein (DUF4415 family)
MAIQFARVDEPAKPAEPKKQTAGQRLIKAAKEARVIAKRGPKPSGKAKQLITLRLDQDVIDAFKASGKGWQSRMNDDLRKVAGL